MAVAVFAAMRVLWQRQLPFLPRLAIYGRDGCLFCRNRVCAAMRLPFLPESVFRGVAG
jgi:hypothetical protein